MQFPGHSSFLFMIPASSRSGRSTAQNEDRGRAARTKRLIGKVARPGPFMALVALQCEQLAAHSCFSTDPAHSSGRRIFFLLVATEGEFCMLLSFKKFQLIFSAHSAVVAMRYQTQNLGGGWTLKTPFYLPQFMPVILTQCLRGETPFRHQVPSTTRNFCFSLDFTSSKSQKKMLSQQL